MADKITSLYNALKADGLFKQARSLNDFKAKMAYQGYRSQIYKLARDKGADVGTFSHFTQALGYQKGSPKPKAQGYGGKPSYQQPQQQDTTNTAMTTAQRALQMFQPQQQQGQQGQIDYLSRPQSQRGKAPVNAPRNASPFVQSLYEIDNAKKGADYPVSYSSPKGVQQVYQQNQQVRKQAAKTAAKQMSFDAAHDQPIMQTNTPADTYIGKTEGQLIEEMNESAENLVKNEKNDNDLINDIISQEIFTESQKRANAAYSKGNWHINPAGDEWDELAHTREANKEFDQGRMIQDLENVVKSRVHEWISNPKTMKYIQDEATRLGVSVDDYVNNSVTPALYNKIAERLPVEDLKRYLPRGRFDFIMGGLTDSLNGAIGALGNQTASQRQLRQEAIQMTNEGENPYFKPTVWDKAGRGAVGFMADAPYYNAAGIGAGAITNKIFGTVAQQAIKTANQSLAQRILTGVAKNMVHGYATGFQYGAVSGAIQNFSTGEDTSLGGTLKAAALSAFEEGTSFSAMEGMGGLVGGLGYKVGMKGTEKGWRPKINHAGQKLAYETIKTGMEGIGMATGSVASSYAHHILTGEDWKGFSTEGTLESCASAVIFKLTHAKDIFKKEIGRDGKPLNFKKSVAQKVGRFFASDELKNSPNVFTESEKKQLFDAGASLGMKPMEGIVSWAKQAKKVKPEELERGEDGSDVLNYYQQIMQDPTVSWDAKAKFTTLVMGTMPESRPMMDYISFGREDYVKDGILRGKRKYVCEYSSKGELLSKEYYDTAEERDNKVYQKYINRENQRLNNAVALLVAEDRNNQDFQNAFFKKYAKDWEQVQELVNGMQTEGSKISHLFTVHILENENGRIMQTAKAVAKQLGMEREDVIKAWGKEPLKRTDAEQNACVQLRRAMENVAFPPNKVHPEQSQLEGKDVAEDNNLGTEQPNSQPVVDELRNLRNAEQALEQAMEGNDVFKQVFEQCKQQGMRPVDAYDVLIQNGLTQEQIAPLAEYINANARVQGMQQATQQAIEENVSARISDWSYKGELNGQKTDEGSTMLYVNWNGKTYLVGNGDVAFDSTGRAKEDVGDMLVCLDPETNTMEYIPTREVTFGDNLNAEGYAAQYRQKLQEINSQPYNQAMQEQAMQDAAKKQNQSDSENGSENAGVESRLQGIPQKEVSSENQEVKLDQTPGQKKDYRDRLSDLGIIEKGESTGLIKNVRPDGKGKSDLTDVHVMLIEKNLERVLNNPNSTDMDFHDAIVFTINTGDVARPYVTTWDVLYKVFAAFKEGKISKEDVINFVVEQTLSPKGNALREAQEAKGGKSSAQVNPIINDGKGGTDKMGNTLNSDGSIYTESVKSVSDITNEDFDTPSRSVELPSIPQNVSSAIGANGKPVIIKKNIFEKNATNHPELDAEDSRAILTNALYNPNLVGQTQPVKRPSYKVAVQTGDKNSIVVLDVYNDKKQVEIVGWRLINEKGLAKMKRQAEREGGQFLILSPNDGSAAALSALPHGSSSAGKDTNNSSNGNGSEATLTFNDGSPVPIKTDSKGRPTPDFDKMTPEQSAEVITNQFGENAEKFVDAQIKKAEEALKKAEKMKVDYSDFNGAMEQESKKRLAIGAAHAQLEKAQNVKKAITAKKVAETVAKPTETERVEGAHEAGSVAAEKFQKATRLVGNKRTRMLADGETKIRGHYEIVPAESLTPSHDVNNGYKKSEGFPVDENGYTINDRDYENDKAAQVNTDYIASKYNGQAIEQVPVVSDEGIVYDGNGRTMAGQKAAKDGTDKEYINDLLENAENFGFTREQIEQSGIEHPRVVLVTDERLPYDTATFAKFNRNEKKAQSNTEQAVAKAKTLTSDEVGAIVADIEGNGSLDAFFNNPNAINDLIKTLQIKGVLGQNEVAGLLEDNGRLNAQGREYVKNLLLGSIFKPGTIRMLGIESSLKNKAISGIRAIMDNMKLGDYSLRDEIDHAIQLMYEAKKAKSKTVAEHMKTSDINGSPRDRYTPIEQAIAQALDGSASLFRDLIKEYNDIAVTEKGTNEGELFDERLTPDEVIKAFIETSDVIKNNDIKLYGNEESRSREQEGGNDAASNEEPAKEAGRETEQSTESESQQQVDEAIKYIATEITKQTGLDVTTDDKVGQSALEDAEATDSNVKYSRVTDKGLIEQLDKEPKIKVYRAMQVIDGKLYPPMAAYADGKLVEANDLGKWIQADEMPDSKNTVYKYKGKPTIIPKDRAIQDENGVWRDSKNGAELVVGEDGNPVWYFKLEKGKGATGKKLTDVPAAYNPYWHTSYSPLNDQFKSAWIRPNVVVVECEVPESELNSGYRAEHAKDPVGMTPWTAGVVTKQLVAQGHEGRKVMLSRWCKPVRILPDSEVAAKIKDFIGGYDVEIPENVVTPRQKIELEKLGVKIGKPEKGMNKNEQIAEAIKLGLQVDNTVTGERKEFRSKNGEVYGFTVDGKIYLDTKKMKPETPLHEYTHLWTEALRNANPKEWENVKKLFDEVDGLKEEVSKLYPELKGDDLYEEMITTFSGREGAKKLEEVVRGLAKEDGKSVTESVKTNGFIHKVKEALQKYWKGVADMLHIHFTSAEEVADKVLADWAKGVNPTEIKGKEEKPKEPSKDPMQGIKDAADAYHEEQKQKGEFKRNLEIGKARQELEEAKKGGNADEIKHATSKLKGLLNEKYKAQGMGFVQRQKEIAKELGKAEAGKIDKPFNELDSEEREYVASQNPLTESEIRELTSEENKNFIEDAVDYINGNHGFAQKIAYLKIYEDVRNRHENVSDNSGTENGTQLDATDITGSEGLGLGTGRESRGTDGQLDSGTGTEPSSREPERREDNQNDPSVPVGEQSNKQGKGKSSDMGAVSTRDTDTEGSGTTGKDGNKPQQGGRGSSNRPAKSNAKRKPTAKQGTTWRGRTGDEIKKNVADKKAAALAAIAELKKRKFGKDGSGTLGMNAILTKEQMEYVPTVMNAVKEYGMAIIDEGIYKVKDWFNHIRETFADGLKDCGFTDQDIDDFVKEMWNSKMTMDDETHTIAEWCSIYGNQKLREKLGEELNEKYQKQMDAEPIKVKVGDMKNIEETLPFLLPQQQEDVLKAETQFFGKEHTDREHAYGKGYMFTNGTGTGKTYTGLGIAKRLAKQGKGRILFVTPSQPKVSDWIKDGKNLGLNIRSLGDWAEERGTTATTESGEGMVITTYANMRQNKKILETEWDAVIYDESHRIMENKKGAETTGSMQHYMVTNRDENHCFLRLQTINPHYQKMQRAADKFSELRQKETERIQKEYKQSHPSATMKDVINATHSKLPKDLNSFAPADAMTFPKLGKAYQDFTQAKQHYYNNVEPKLKEQAKKTWKNTKTIFLSATPFNTRENLDYAEGYIFKYPEDDGSRMSGRSRFYLDHFGAAYRYRYNRLESKTDNPAAVAKQEIAFSDYLQNNLGTMSGRIIDSAYDYSRDFPTVAPEKAETFNQAVEEAVKGRYLGEAYSKTIGNYVYGSALFETMKVANIIQRMKDHLDAGRKIVVFHRRVETKEPLTPPFATMLEYANNMIKEMKPGKEQNEAIRECTEFRNKYADLLNWEQTLDYSMPREQIAKAFGKDNVLFFSGKETSKVKNKAVETFNDDNSGKNIIVIQEASGKEGISLHDVTGNHQRVLITLGLPQSPITALQIEGRIYRIGNMSNAIFEYPILGLNSEMMLFGEKFNNQVSTTENLALGSQARNLRDSFAKGILEHSGIVPIDQQGVGGKEFDAPKQSDSDPFDDAVLDYYSNQKLNRNNREGIDYFPTPEPLGYKMMEWANVGEGDSILEPSAGHGAIARYAPQSNELLSIEPSQSLFTKLQLNARGLGRKFLNNTFENYNVANKHDVVVMNPPFGTAGATAIAHLDKAFKHLDEGGRVVALIPRGSTDKKFDKWYGEQKNVAMRAEIDLPDIVFQQAGTSVRCRVVVLDKITDADLRSKAGYPEKVDLSGHYDKIEDFFEDLRDVQMPDRIIDTQAKYMKKARTFKKDIEDIKGMKFTLWKQGVSVSDMNRYVDYNITFPSDKMSEEWTKENFSKLYENFEYEKNRAYNEHSKAALDEMKKLACKLAGMSEEEMQKYIADKKNGGTHFREERGVQYSKTDTKDVKNERIIPSDVDKSVSSQIEKKFDDAVENEIKEYSDTEKADFMDVLDMKIKEFSHMRASDIDNQLKAYEYDYREWSAKFGGNGSGKNLIRRKAAEYRAATIAAEREMDYRKARAEAIRDNYGLQGGRQTSIDALATIFEKDNRGQDKVREGLFQKASLLLKKLGTEITVDAEAPDVNRNALGSSGINRDIRLYLDTATRTSVKGGELSTTILHEMIHQVTNGAINLVKKGKAEGLLTPKQIEAVNDILDIYNKVKDDKERFKENTYGLKNEYELTAQMADPRQRKAMDLSVWDRVVNAAHELARKGDRSILQRLKDAVKKLFEVSDKDKMDKAINDIMDDFNETVDDISMNEIDKDGFANAPVKVSDNAPVVVKHVAEVAKKVGGKANMVNSVEEVTNPQAKKAIESGKHITGWYDEKTGEVHLYMPNIHDRYTAEKTIWHEVVGHKGMRELFGEDRFDKFLRDVWYDLDKPEYADLKKLVDEERRYNPLNISDAIEEGIARLAEDGRGEAGFWRNIKNKVSDFLHEIGYRIAPNTKDVKYLLWLSKNLQKNPNDPYWKMRAEAVKYRLDHEDIPAVTERDGMFHDNDGKIYKGLEDLPKTEYQEATDGQIHFRTTPSAGTALDRYHRALNAHGYMFTESYMDSMKSLQELMKAIMPDTKIEDIKSSENPYMLQNTMQGAMSDAAQMFERNVMKPLDKAMADVLDAFDGDKTDDKIRNFNLYMIAKHGLERNRVFFVRDHIRTLDPTDAKTMQKEWSDKKKDLGDKLRNGSIDLKEYYNQMDEWIRSNVDSDYKAEEHDYSGFHGLQEIADKKSPYDDNKAIQSVKDSESRMESTKKGSVDDFWNKIKNATQYSLDREYNGGLVTKENHDNVSGMFDWYVPLRKFDETTAEDVYGYVTEKGDPGSFIGSTLMKARGRKSLSETNILAQIGAMGNASINRAGQNAIKQAFARFIRNNGGQDLVTETNVWVEKVGQDNNGNPIWKESYPQIPEDATADEIAKIISDFNTDMEQKKAAGEAKNISQQGNIGFKFERAKDKSQHIVDVMIAGKKHSFIVNGNPRAAQALNGLLEHKNDTGAGKVLGKISRFMAQTCTSYNPEFVMRNMIRDFEFASSNLLAKEGVRYTSTFEKYYAKVGLIEGIRNSKLSDFKDTGGFGLFAKYRNGTLDMNDKVQRYFKEFMENGGETGWVQVKNMKEWTEEYKRNIKTETYGFKIGDKKVKPIKIGKGFYDAIFKNLENVNEVAENMARFATYCASRDYNRSVVRSVYDAKEVSTNFNRHGSGSEIKSFKNGEMGKFQELRKQTYRFTSAWFRNTSMFFNAGIQSTNLLVKNLKNNTVGTLGYITSGPMISGMAMALLNNFFIANEDEKERNGVKDPYGELPDYIRRNNLCVYVGKGEFVTIPLAIEERAFYGLGDLAAGLTFSKNIASQKMPNLTENKAIDKYLNPVMDAVGCISQLVPVADYLGNASFGKHPVQETVKAVMPSATSPFIEWFANSDWKGAPIERDNKFDENQPSWMLAYHGTPDFLINLNKKVNAYTNDVAKGNENMKGNDFLDAVTNPSGLQHFYSSYLGGAATFAERTLGLVKHGSDTETKDIPFVRSLFYTPSEQSSLQRTKSKWYNYKEEMEKTMANVDRLKSKNVPIDQRLSNIGDYYNFQNSKDAAKVRVIELAEKQMKRWKKLQGKASDTESIKFANQNIEQIMMRAVEQLDKLN